MLLEDHAGEIVRRAREAAGLSRDEAARLAGLSTADFTQFANTARFHDLAR